MWGPVSDLSYVTPLLRASRRTPPQAQESQPSPHSGLHSPAWHCPQTPGTPEPPAVTHSPLPAVPPQVSPPHVCKRMSSESRVILREAGPLPQNCVPFIGFTAPHRALSTSHTCICNCPACRPSQEQDLCLLAVPPTRHRVSALQAS